MDGVQLIEDGIILSEVFFVVLSIKTEGLHICLKASPAGGLCRARCTTDRFRKKMSPLSSISSAAV